jgi:hypothetical protein
LGEKYEKRMRRNAQEKEKRIKQKDHRKVSFVCTRGPKKSSKEVREE